MERMNLPRPIPGDDLAYNTMYLRDIPEGYHFADLVPDPNLPISYEMWDALTDFAERYYANWEVNGATIMNWFNGLQLSYDMNKKRFEELLKSLADVKFDKGQTTERTISTNESRLDNRSKSRDGSRSENNDRSYGEYGRSSQTANAREIDLAFDSNNEDPSKKTTTSQNDTNNVAGNETARNSVTDSGSESEQSDGQSALYTTEKVSIDRFQGEDSLTYYERLMKTYPNIFSLFTDMFREDFLIHEVMIWR